MIMVDKCSSINNTIEINSFILNGLLLVVTFVVLCVGIYIMFDIYNTFIKKD